jgi:hypothetical protein
MLVSTTRILPAMAAQFLPAVRFNIKKFRSPSAFCKRLFTKHVILFES